MQQHIAKMLVEQALKHNIPAAADKYYHPGDQVLFWREKIVKTRIGECLGPFLIMRIDAQKNIVYIKDVKVGNSRPLKSSDTIATSTAIFKAMKYEIKILIERRTFKVILQEKVSTDANVLPGSFLLSINSKEDGNTISKPTI